MERARKGRVGNREREGGGRKMRRDKQMHREAKRKDPKKGGMTMRKSMCEISGLMLLCTQPDQSYLNRQALASLHRTHRQADIVSLTL